jgi:hypothetical protein
MDLKQQDRRRFSREELTESAIAVDDSGFHLGRVSQASGGGMQVQAASEEAKRRMPIGARLHITIVEPRTGTSNAMNVEVRYIDNDSVGMQFV